MANRVLSTEGWSRLPERIIGSLRLQISQTRSFLLLACIGVLIGLTPTVILIELFQVNPESLTRDIFASTNSPIYTGLLSNLGLFGWAAAAAIWLLTALLLMRVDWRHPMLPFVVGSGLFSGLLLFDDAFMFHEMVLPDYLGIHEKVVMVGYVLIAIAYVGLNIRHMLRSPYILLIIAIGFLALSMAIDELFQMTELETLIEDVLKFTGIVFWATYAVASAIQIVERLISAQVVLSE